MTDQQRAHGQQNLLDLLCTHLVEQHGCHPAILYGSRAHGDWASTSDIDVLALRDTGEAGQIACRWQDLFLDLFVYPTATKPTVDWARLHGGRVLFQRASMGNEVLAAVDVMLAAAPDRLRPEDVQTRRLWSEKMLVRAEKGDPESDERRHWLLTALLEDYFALRGQWYFGPKRSSAVLQREKPQYFIVFRKAFMPSALIADIQDAITMVIETENL